MNMMSSGHIDEPDPTTEPSTPAGMGEHADLSKSGVEHSPDSRTSSHWLAFAVTAAVVVALDQLTKRYVDARLALQESWPDESWPVRFMHVKNTGAAFSMLQNQTFFLTVMSVLGLGAIVLYFRYRPSDHPLLRTALALQLGGAAGNLIDRARYGHVTDFIKVPHWPVFNIADSAITVGVATVVVFLLFAGGEHGERDRRVQGSGAGGHVDESGAERPAPTP